MKKFGENLGKIMGNCEECGVSFGNGNWFDLVELCGGDDGVIGCIVNFVYVIFWFIDRCIDLLLLWVCEFCGWWFLGWNFKWFLDVSDCYVIWFGIVFFFLNLGVECGVFEGVMFVFDLDVVVGVFFGYLSFMLFWFCCFFFV